MAERRPHDVELYRRGREHLLGLLDGADTETMVTACPTWRVRDVVAHVTGIASDFVVGRLPGGDVGAWTAEQVEARRDVTLDTVLDEWERVAPEFEEAMAGRLAGASGRLAADVISHSFDVAAALGRPLPRQGELVEGALATFADMLTARLDQAGSGGVVIDTGSSQLIAGTATPVATLRADTFSALRVLSGRRTADEIRSLGWEGDPGPVYSLLSPYPLPERSLGE